jgi:alpha-tubulin suppressor-like RCC1 family protein
VKVIGLPSGAVAVGAGESHSCALLADGTAYCWGDNSVGQLGIGSIGGRNATPIQVIGIGGSVNGKAIAVGGSFACAERSNGTMSCWATISSACWATAPN